MGRNEFHILPTQRSLPGIPVGNIMIACCLVLWDVKIKHTRKCWHLFIPFSPLPPPFLSASLSLLLSTLVSGSLHSPSLYPSLPLSSLPSNPPPVFLPSDPSVQTSQISPLQGLNVDILFSPLLSSSTRQKRIKTLSLYLH